MPVPLDAQERLRNHLADSRGAVNLDGLLFTTRTGRPLSYTTWRTRRWRRIVERGGIGELRPHDLRHTAAIRLFVVDWWTPAERQAFLSYGDPRFALRTYTHVHADDLPAPTTRLSLPYRPRPYLLGSRPSQLKPRVACTSRAQDNEN